MPNPSDMHHMRHALRLGARALGRAWPNPAVGAVVVKDGVIVGRGWTARGGRPHAEPQALAQAGEAAKGATLYVTLEPCAHQGETPPCVKAIIAAGITRVVGACADPNPKAGGGFRQLQEAGIEVTQGVCEAEARASHEGFFSTVEKKRPFVTLKLATSLDDKITRADDERWITNALSRARGHWLRATHDAILTGIGTVLADDPQMTCRLPGREADSPQRVVLDTHLRIPGNAKALPAWIFTSAEARQNNAEKVKHLEAKGSRLFIAPSPAQASAYALRASADESPSPPSPQGGEGRVRGELGPVLQILAQEGITRLLVEAGNAVASAFVSEGLVDRLYWFRAPLSVGEQGLPALSADMPHLHLRSTDKLGDDTVEIFDIG